MRWAKFKIAGITAFLLRRIRESCVFILTLISLSSNFIIRDASLTSAICFGTHFERERIQEDLVGFVRHRRDAFPHL